jgi:eukaryotic-like serine/threonine-protein kinase
MASSAFVAQGPGSISVGPLTGGNLETIYTNPNLAIVAIQTITPTRLLFYVYNFSSQQGQSVDTSQNGLWTINIDGSGLTHLTTATVKEPAYLQYAEQRQQARGALVV